MFRLLLKLCSSRHQFLMSHCFMHIKDSSILYDFKMKNSSLQLFIYFWRLLKRHNICLLWSDGRHLVSFECWLLVHVWTCVQCRQSRFYCTCRHYHSTRRPSHHKQKPQPMQSHYCGDNNNALRRYQSNIHITRWHSSLKPNFGRSLSRMSWLMTSTVILGSWSDITVINVLSSHRHQFASTSQKRWVYGSCTDCLSAGASSLNWAALCTQGFFTAAAVLRT